MSEDMSLSVTGPFKVPPGFRFQPTEEELLHYYLRKKVANEKIDWNVIQDVDLNKLEPWDIQESCKIRSTLQNEWYIFSHKDKKYPIGTRTNRATVAGFWKATGRDKVIYNSFKGIGMRKTLVFYKGRAPHGQKTDWIMHEYRLDNQTNEASNLMGKTTQEEGWVVCRVFKKKTHHKTLNSPKKPSSITSDAKVQILNTSNNGQEQHEVSQLALEQIVQYKERTSKQETKIDNTININTNSNNMRFLSPIEIAFNNGLYERYMQLPALESPNDIIRPDLVHYCCSHACYTPIDEEMPTEPVFHDWNDLDRLVATNFNGQGETWKQLACINEPTMGLYSPTDQELQLPQQLCLSNRLYHTSQDYSHEIDLWSFM